VALAAARHGVAKFVFSSTVGLHPRQSPEVITEESRFDITNPYEASKAETEEFLRATARETGLSIAVLRPADVYGPGDLRLLKLFRGVARQRFPLVGAGTGRRHMLFIDDLTGALLAACERDSGPYESFIIAGPQVITLRALLERLTKLLGVRRFGFRVPFAPMMAAATLIEAVCGVIGVPPPIHRRSLDFFLTDVEYDTSKARRTLQWTPLVSLDSGLQQTIDWYRQERLL
jgi:nucleoside-diphosphate-sugar epimerase